MIQIYQDNLLREFIENSMDAFIIINKKDQVVEWNRKAEVLFGWSSEEAIGNPFSYLIVPCIGYSNDDFLNQRLEMPVRTKAGELIRIELTITPIKIENETFFAACIRDIRMKQKEQDDLTRKANLLNLSRDAIYVIDSAQRLILWSKGAEKMYGFTESEALGKIAHVMLQTSFEEGFTGKTFNDVIQDLLVDQSWEGEIVQTKKTGEKVTILSRWSLDPDKKEILITNTDITDLKKNQERAEYLATHDELTGLPNRRLLDDRVEHAIDRSHRDGGIIGIMLLDLDRFKVINDSLGHDKGDLLLKEISLRLKNSVREDDTVARLGGDEFVIMLEALSSSDSIGEIAKKIITNISQPLMIDSHEIRVDTSIGISIFPADGTDFNTLTRNADMAMYQAKSHNTGSYKFYSSEMNDVVQQRLIGEHRLRAALENNEFVLHYQPKICSSENKTTGVEALIRWEHPKYGMISPTEFIPLAEEIGIIGQIGEWALREACKQNKLWQIQGKPPIQISVNLSVCQLQPSIIKMISSVLDDTGLDPRWLDLEITESAAMKNVETTIQTLEKIRDLGVSLSIDDFGTGYSSLSYLKRMPLNNLKIDQSFVRGIPSDNNDVCIVRTIIAMAHSMGLKVIAEGVTDNEQVAFLDTMKCDEMQGFLFSHPTVSSCIENDMIDKHWEYPYR